MAKRAFTQEEREKAKKSLREGAARRKILKTLESVRTVDLGPLEEEIRKLESRIAELKALRTQVLAFRDGTLVANTTPTGNGKPTLEQVNAIADSSEPGWKKVQAYLRINPGAKPAVIAADTRMEASHINAILNKHEGSAFERKGYGMWYAKNGQETTAQNA